MTPTPRVRKLLLTVHVVTSVGWLGAVVAYVALAVVGLTSQDPQVAQASYLSMWVGARFVVVPFSIATMLSGMVEAITTRWGLFRHWWVVAKLALTTVAALILWQHVPAVLRMATLARDSALAAGDLRALQLQLVLHAVGGLLVLLTATALSVYKPRGMTPLARRHEGERRDAATFALAAPVGVTPASNPAMGAPRWVYVVGIHAAVLAAAIVVLHLSGGGIRH